MSLTLAGAALITQGALGVGQTLYGAIKKKPKIPEAEIPQELYENMTDAEYWSYIGMPEEQRQRYVDDLRASTSAGLNRISDRRGGLGAVSSLAQGERQGIKDIAEMDTSMRMNNIDKLYQSRGQYAQAKMMTDEANRNIAQTKRNEILGIAGAGMQNVMGAMGTGASLSAQYDGSLFKPKTQAV